MVLKYLLGDSLGPRRYKTSSTSPRSRTALGFVIIGVILLSVYYAAPNLYLRGYYTLQILERDLNRDRVRPRIASIMRDYLDETNASYQDIYIRNVKDKRVLEVLFKNEKDMLAGRALLERQYGNIYHYSYATRKRIPAWLERYGGKPVNLGLDLNGGVHFLMEVDTQAAIRQRVDIYATQMRNLLRRERVRSISFTIDEPSAGLAYPAIKLAFATEETNKKAKDLLEEVFQDMEMEEWREGGVYYMRFVFPEAYVQQLEDFAIDQNMATLRERINELGVSEPLVQQQGAKRIVVQIPGIQDTVAAKRIIGSTANLEFRLESLSAAAAESFRLRRSQDRAQLERSVIITGGNVINAQVQYDENSLPQVAITLDTEGGRLINRATRTNIGRNMAVLLVESFAQNITRGGEGETSFNTRTTKEIISLATIRDSLGSRFVITGLANQQEATNLALLLRAGALAAPIYFVEERTIGASLGKDNIRKGMLSLAAGLLMVMLFILLYYKLAGVFANIALLLNLFLILAIMSQLGAALTLPGIAGMVLTVGMAIDANILIFSRIKEELKSGLQSLAAIGAGYDRAFITILDANITTLLVAVILFAIGTGAVKGFAITLSIGILCSLFTSIVVTRQMMEWSYARGRLTKISI